MTTLRLPQFTIESNGMRKSKSMVPLCLLKEASSSGGSSPLPGTLQTFVNDFEFDSLQPRSKSAEPLGNFQKNRQEKEETLEDLKLGLIFSGMISAENIYSVGVRRSFNGDEEDIKFCDLNQVQRSHSLDAATDDVLTKGLLVPSSAYRSCSLLEKPEDRYNSLVEHVRRNRLD